MLVANQVTQIGLRQRSGREVKVLDLKLRLHRIDHLIVDNRIDCDNHIIGGDDLLGQDIDDLLTHVNANQAVDKRDQKDQSGIGRVVITPKADDETLLILLDDTHAKRQRGNGNNEDQS